MNTDAELIETAYTAAMAAKRNAYAPYSHFHVGAALIHRSGKIYGGCNVENASYGATICAERNAIISAIADCGKPDFTGLVVVSDAEPPAVPCALCLQVISEFCESDFPIHLANGGGIVHTLKLGDLLPRPFNEIPAPWTHS